MIYLQYFVNTMNIFPRNYPKNHTSIIPQISIHGNSKIILPYIKNNIIRIIAIGV